MMAGSTTTRLGSRIMPTVNGRRFIAGAIARFLADDDNAPALIILDNGEDAGGNIGPLGPRRSSCT